MPAHVVEYSYMTETFRVFINGCTGQAYGIQQQSIVSAMLNVINKASGTIVPALEAVLKVRMRQLATGSLLPFDGIAGCPTSSAGHTGDHQLPNGSAATDGQNIVLAALLCWGTVNIGRVFSLKSGVCHSR
jgi:hypothetical protein